MGAIILGSVIFGGFEQEQTALFAIQALAVSASLVAVGGSAFFAFKTFQGERPHGNVRGVHIVLDAFLAIGVMAFLDASTSPLAWVALIAPVLETAVFFSVSAAASVWIGLSLSFLALRLTTNVADQATNETLLLSIQQVLAVLFISGPAALVMDSAQNRMDNLSDARTSAEDTSYRLRRVTDFARKMAQHHDHDEILALSCQGVTAIGFDQADVVVTNRAGEATIHSIHSNGHGSQLPVEVLADSQLGTVREVDIADPIHGEALQMAGFASGVAMLLSNKQSTDQVLLRAWTKQKEVTPEHSQTLELLVGHARETYRSTEILQKAQEYSNQLLHEVQHDGLTGIANRTFVRQRLSELIRTRQQFAIFYIDLDGFKQINDTQGHNFGDEALIAVAERLRTTGRQGEIAGRMGGDEFMLITPLTAFDTLDTLIAHGNQVVESVSQPIVAKGQAMQLGASLGVAINDGKLGTDQIISLADAAMYEAKRHGGGTQVSPASIALFQQQRAS